MPCVGQSVCRTHTQIIKKPRRNITPYACHRCPNRKHQKPEIDQFEPSMRRNPKGNRQELKRGYNSRKQSRSKRFRLYTWLNKRRREGDHAPTACWRRFSEEGGSTARCSLREVEVGDGVVRSSVGVVRWPWWMTEPEPEVERGMFSFSETGCSDTGSEPMMGVKGDGSTEGPPRSSCASLKNSIGSSLLRRLMPVVVLALRME